MTSYKSLDHCELYFVTVVSNRAREYVATTVLALVRSLVMAWVTRSMAVGVERDLIQIMVEKATGSHYSRDE